MAQPTTRQLEYLNKLITEETKRQGVSTADIQVELGLRERNQWGTGPWRDSAFTAANISRLITKLRSK